jgi:hypothetical protein
MCTMRSTLPPALDDTPSSVPGIILLEQCFRSDHSPRTLDQIRQLSGFDRREAHEDPRVVPVVIRYEESVRRRLQENLAIQKVRAKDEAIEALVHPCKQLAADLQS